jgi:hypothetical protein
MKLKLFGKIDVLPPPVFADLFIDTLDDIIRVDVEQDGWIETHRSMLERSVRIGLGLKADKVARVWLRTNGSRPVYFSRVVGTIGLGNQDNKRARVACIECNGMRRWLHANGVVEKSAEPTVSWPG